MGDTIKISCDEGYRPNGRKSIRCTDGEWTDGEWEHEFPTCDPAECPELRSIRYGTFTITYRPHPPSSRQVLILPEGEIELGRKKRSYNPFPSIGQSSSSYDYYYGGQESGGSDYYGQSAGDSDYGGQLSGGDFDSFTQSSGGEADYISQSSGGLTLGQMPSPDYEDFGQSAQTQQNQVFYYSTKVEYNCRPGYQLLGSKTRTCNSEGDWDNPKPRCYENHCPKLSAIDNGYPIYQGSGANSQVEFNCNDGYTLEGDFEIVCQADKSWLGLQPKCEMSDCGDPNDIENGTVSFSTTTYGSVAIYDCYVGHVLEGSFERFCVNGGFWNGSMPRCIEVTCNVPPVIDNGYITFEGSLYVGSPIEYECKECFKLNGTRFRHCQLDGTWNLVEPICDMIFCEELPMALLNGKIIGNDNSCGSLIEFECNPGYNMQGRKTTTCLENQRWSSKMPTCERVSCGTPYLLQFGQIIGDSYTFTDKITYKCNEGYVLRGTNIRVCQVDGSWSDRDPYCDIKNCTKPQGPSNGRVRLSGLFYGATANIVCDPGYKIDGPRNLLCTKDSVWDHDMPYCIPIICPPAPLIDHGSFNSTERQFESFTTLIYDCDTGYFVRDGHPNLLCNEYGEWEGNVISCEIQDCGNPGTLPDGNIEGDVTTYKGLISFNCSEGYILIGEASATCLSDGTWSNYVTSCVQVTCEDPTFIENAKLVVDDSQAIYGTSLHYECDSGFILSGKGSMSCEMNGKWSTEPPSCSIVKCTPPLEDLNSLRQGNIFEFGETVNYTCNEGFVMEGSQSVTCLETGTWSDGFPVCEMITCEPPADIINGIYESRKVSDIPIKTEALQDNIIHEHSKTRKSGKLVSLLQDSQLREGILYHYGDIVEFECHEGHSLSSERLLSCTENGWNLPSPSCHAITCPIPISIRNGDVLVDDVIFGSVLEYNCNDGYELVGDQYRTCHSDKEWSGTEPYCRIIECQRPASLDDGQTIGSSFKFKSILSYVCNSGFKLQGVGTR